MMKLLRRILSLDFWFRIEENSVYRVQEGEEEFNFLKSYNASYSEQLLEKGYSPETPVEIFHFFYFKKDKDLEKFTNQIRKYDFIPVGKFSIHKDENYQAGYEIMRIDKTNKESIAEFTTFLWETSVENNLLYKGWEVRISENND